MARVPGSHFVSAFDFDPEVQSQYHFPEPLALIDSTLRKTHFTAGHTTSRLGFQRIAEALADLGVKDESININWAGSQEPIPQDWALLEAIVEGDFGFRLNVYTDTLLGDGRTPTAVSMRRTVDLLVAAGVKVAAPGIVPAPDADAQQRQLDDLVAYFEYAAGVGLETTITLANVGRRDFGALLTMANHAVALGARRLDLMDSTSSLSPEAMKVFIRRFRAGLASEVPLTMHSHDEFGLATACAIAAATEGASPDVSLNGMSYRAGFAPLEEVVLALETLYGVDTGLHLDRIYPAAQVVAAMSGVPIAPLKPLIGGYAYLKHMPGDAAAAIREGQDSFPPISHGLVPAKMGQRVTWVWGGASSDAMVVELARARSIELAGPEIAVLRRAMDAAVARVPSYPRWLSPEAATDLFDRLVRGLRRPVEAAPVREMLALAVPYSPLRAGIPIDRPTADVVQAVRSAILHALPAEVAAFAAAFDPLGADKADDDERGRLSAAEEAGVLGGEADVRRLIVESAEKYEAVTGYRYVAAVEGLDAQTVLARLRFRLTAAPDDEMRTTRREMAAIVDQRLIKLLVLGQAGQE